MFSTKCGMCGTIQTEEDASKLTGTSIVMNGVTKHACAVCVEILKVAFAAGKDAITDPQKALERLTAEKDQLQRKVQQLELMQGGGVLSLEEIGRNNRRITLDNPTRGGVPLLGMPLPLGGRQALPAAVEPAPAPPPPLPAPSASEPEPKKGLMGRILGGDGKKKKDKNK